MESVNVFVLRSNCHLLPLKVLLMIPETASCFIPGPADVSFASHIYIALILVQMFAGKFMFPNDISAIFISSKYPVEVQITDSNDTFLSAFL